MNGPIEKLRETFVWGSYGKYHDEPLKKTLLKDISDSHLLHIIAWIEGRRGTYTFDILQTMRAEQHYRCQNYIFVKEYDDTKSS